MPHKKKYVVNAGDRYGRLVVLKENKEYAKLFGAGRREIFYDVRCDCGVEFTTRKYGLTSGSTKSCGCLRSEILKNRPESARKKRRVILTARGETHTLLDWAGILGVSANTLYNRRFRHGNVPEIVLKELYNEEK